MTGQLQGTPLKRCDRPLSEPRTVVTPLHPPHYASQLITDHVAQVARGPVDTPPRVGSCAHKTRLVACLRGLLCEPTAQAASVFEFSVHLKLVHELQISGRSR